MKIFCPRCGKENQSNTTFCRKCGDELPELKEKVNNSNFRKKIKNLSTVNLVISSISSLFCSSFAIYLLNTSEEFNGRFEFVVILFLLLSIVFLSSTFLSVYINYYLKKTDLQIDDKKEVNKIDFKEKDLLPVADFSSSVPPSVVENTTRKLEKEVINRKNI